MVADCVVLLYLKETALHGNQELAHEILSSEYKRKQPSTLCALTHWHACHMHYIINCHVLSELPEKGSGVGPISDPHMFVL